MELSSIVCACAGFLGAWLAPGAALTRVLRLGRSPLERVLVSVALGRLAFALVSLISASSVGAVGVRIWAVVGVLAWLAALRFGPVPPPRKPGRSAGSGLPVLVGVSAATLLVVAVVARGGLAGGEQLVFYGRDSTNDPLVYAALALQLFDRGLPLSWALLGGGATTSTYVPYGVLVGLHALGVPMLDAVLRVAPFLDATLLAASGVALTRMLGGGTLAAALGGALVVLGGDPSFWLRPLGALVGTSVQPLDTWTLFGPYLLAFNPAAPALQTAVAALLLLGAPGPEPRRAAWVAGLLVAGIVEIKLFVWAPLFGALVLVALCWPPPGLAGPLRRAAAVAAAVCLPALLEKAWWASALRGQERTGFELCAGCLPRYLADAALGSHDLSFRIFETHRLAQWLDLGHLALVLASALLVVAVALGARVVALPALWRGSRSSDPAGAGRVAVHRIVAGASVLGLLAALVVTTRPHYLNGAQFAWIPCVLLWSFAAIPVARWWSERRLLCLGLFAALALPGALRALGPLGFRAPVVSRVSADELALVDALRSRSRPEELVLEPSLLADTDFPSPVTWRAGRPVYLSLLSAAQALPEPEMYARHERLVAIFAGAEAPEARSAIATSGASWLLAPSAWPLRFETGPLLEPVHANPAGVLYRVRASDQERKP